MSSSPVLVLDIDGVVSLAQPGSAEPWYATLQADWGFDHDEMARDFFRREFSEVLRGRLDLYVALQAYLETKGLADRLEEFVAYWFARTPSSTAACWTRPTPGDSARAGTASPPPTRSTIASLICARRPGSARISTRSSIRRRWACASPTACSSPPPRRAWAYRWRSRSCSSTIQRPTSTR